MKTLTLAVALLCSAGALIAQPDPIKWGKIDQADLEMSVYPSDSTAKAAVLGDYGEAYFTYSNDKGFQLNIKQHVRIKILHNEGLEWANVEIPLYTSGTSRETITGLKASTYNLEGGKEDKVKISKSDIFEEQVNENLTLYKFTLPGVKVGSVIEYEYHKVSDFLYGLETWVFQKTIPTRWSEFRARIPEYFFYKNLMSGHYLLAIQEKGTYQDRFDYKGETLEAFGNKEKYSGTLTPFGETHRWAMKDLPALKEEAYTTKLSDYASKIEFELSYTKFPGQTMKYYSSDWERLSKEFMSASRFGGELKKQKQVSELVAMLTAGKQKQEDKLVAVYRYVQQNVRYNGQERVYMTKSFKDVLKDKEGNSSEINLLLTAMLREANLAANPVILSTRQHGRVNPVIPLAQNFNYVVSHVMLGEKYLLLDATDGLLPIGFLPYRCMNDRGRLVSEEFTSWVSLLNNEKESDSYMGKLKVMADGRMKGTLTHQVEGYDAIALRRKVLTDGEANYFENRIGKKSHWQVEEHKFENLKNLSEKLEEHFSLEISDKATSAGDRLYVSLLPEGVLEHNPFKLDKRVYPVNFGCPLEQKLSYELEIPEGYQIEQLPEFTQVILPDKSAVFRYNVVQMGNKLTVTSIMQIKKPVYLPEEYGQLKEFYRLMLAKQNEQVVLVKKSK